MGGGGGDLEDFANVLVGVGEVVRFVAFLSIFVVVIVIGLPCESLVINVL